MMMKSSVILFKESLKADRASEWKAGRLEAFTSGWCKLGCWVLLQALLFSRTANATF